MDIIYIYVGDTATFVDSKGAEINALVTSVFGWNTVEERNEVYKEENKKGSVWANDEWLKNVLSTPHTVPSVNLVYVSNDSTQTDSYGRQIARSTSVPHQSVQPAPGYYWKK